MIKRVAYTKAVTAGLAGAIAWELLGRVLIFAGVPIRDNIYLLGTLVYPHANAWQWLLLGTAVHCSVGIMWAVFYAYFFWAVFPWRPAVQGLVFSMGITVLAGLIVIPQIDLMHPLIASQHLPHAGIFARNAGVLGPLNLIVGHAIYGLILGALYTHPVGYPTRRGFAHV